MIRQVIRGATFERDAYLRAVIGTNGTGDAVIIVVAVYVVLALTVSPWAVTDFVGLARFVLNGAFAWVILTGIIYLITRHGMRGEGSFQGVLAMSALAHPVLVLSDRRPGEHLHPAQLHCPSDPAVDGGMEARLHPSDRRGRGDGVVPGHPRCREPGWR